MNKEQLDYKLNMIFNELIDIRGMLEEQQRDKRKIKAKEQIDKAIEYIKSFDYYIPEDDKPKLLDILKGSDKE